MKFVTLYMLDGLKNINPGEKNILKTTLKNQKQVV